MRSPWTWGDGAALERYQPQPAVAPDGTSTPALPRPAFMPARLLAGAAYVVPTRDQVSVSTHPEAPPAPRRRRKRRELVHRGRTPGASGGGSSDKGAGDSRPGDRRSRGTIPAEPTAPTPPTDPTSAAPAAPTDPGSATSALPVEPRSTAPAPPEVQSPEPTPPAEAANADDPPAGDVAFRSDDDEQFATDGQVAIPIPTGDQRDGGSVSLWVQPGWERDNRDDATLVQLGEQVRVSKSYQYLRFEAAGNDRDVGFPIADWNPGEWHHVAATWRGNALSLYVDGALVGRQTGREPVDLLAETDLRVGSDHSEDRPVARGVIARVDVRNRPLGDDEVTRDYRGALDGSSQDDGRARWGHGGADRGVARDVGFGRRR